jgi:hypothetical protein
MLVNVVPDSAYESIQSTERGQFEALLDQMLDGHIDQVRWITHGISGLLHQALSRFGTAERIRGHP